MKTLILTFLTIILFVFSAKTTTYGQATDCYPGCTVTAQMVLNERVPLFTSVAASSNHCDADVIVAMKKQFEDEDKAQMILLRNQYCSAISGWEQVGECEHGGPPPCCTYTGPNPPWINVGSEKGKEALMKKWHAVQNERRIQIQNALNQCLSSLTTDRINTFKLVYQEALDCVSGLKGSTAYMRTNSQTYNNFIYRLNTLRDEAQSWINATDPDNLQNVINTLIPLKNEICNVKIPNAPQTNADVNNNKTITKPETHALGNQTQQYQNNSADAITQATQLGAAKINLAYSQTHGGNSAVILQQQQRINQLQKQQQQNQNLKNTLNSAVSVINLLEQGSQQAQQQREADEAKQAQEKADREAQEEADRREQKMRTQNANKEYTATIVNNSAPEIQFTQSDGSLFKLSNYIGKKVLLVFWASYNDNSVAQFNFIKTNFSYLTSKHIIVIGIAQEFNRYQWQKAIQENQLPGLQISEIKGLGNDTYVNYKITELPTLFYINATGQVVTESNTLDEIIHTIN